MSLTFPVVAIASDASDTQPVVELLSVWSGKSAAALVIVQSLQGQRPKPRDSVMADLGEFSVVQAHDGVELEAAHAYLAPPDSNLSFAGERICVTPRPRGGGPELPGDALMRSLAEVHSTNGVGVVLSGAGTDGAQGLRAIRERGGVTFVQYPGSARIPSMPINAIETGCVDFVLRPNEIAHRLVGLLARARDAEKAYGAAPRVGGARTAADNPGPP